MSAVKTTTPALAALGLACLALASCGGGSSGATSTLALSLVDAPVTGATSVWVQFTGVEIKPVNGPAQSFTFSPAKGYDLLTLQNGNAATLLGDTTVDAGDYEWVRLIVDTTPDSSYVVDSSGHHGLRIPSGAETGLKLIRGFTMPAGGRADFTIDFVLDQSIIAPPGQSPNYLMKPVLRMTNNVEVGTLQGTISAAKLATVPSCTGKTPRVYLYEGASIVPDDIYNPLDGSTDTAPAVAPLVTATGMSNGSGAYTYHIGYVRTGTYTVAFTCDDDDPLVDENAPPAIPLNFTVYPSPVVISTGQTATADF
jgi:hypothetical protein